jgi:prophage tail gpP-like protein
MNALSPIDAGLLVSLEVGGRRYEGWKSARIKRAIDQLSGSFTLDIADTWPDRAETWQIEPGAECVLKIGADVVVTGYVDSVKVRATATEHVITVDGRDKTADLVDCSAEPREWQGLTFEQVAADVCKPYGIKVLTQLSSGAGGYESKKPSGTKAPSKPAAAGGGALPRKASNSGETCHKLLEKLAKLQGVLLVSDGRGGIVITRAGLNGRADDVLAVGQNIKALDYERNFANLFSKITVKGQSHGAQPQAAPALSGAGQQRVKAAATVQRAQAASAANKIDRYRPLIIAAEEQADAKRCQDRAQWEASTREAKSKKISVSVQGWRQSTGRLWEINTLVRMKSQFVREDEDLLISSLEFGIDIKGGTISNMVLMSPQAFDVLKEIPPTSKGDGAKKSARTLSGARQ